MHLLPSTLMKRDDSTCGQRNDGVGLIESDMSDLMSREISNGVDGVFRLAGQPGVRMPWGTVFSEYFTANAVPTEPLPEAGAVRALQRFRRRQQRRSTGT